MLIELQEVAQINKTIKMFKTIAATFLLISLANNCVSAQSREFKNWSKEIAKRVAERQKEIERYEANMVFMEYQKSNWGCVDAFFNTRDIIVLQKHPKKNKYYKRTFYANGEKTKHKEISLMEYKAIKIDGVGRNILYLNNSKKRIRNLKQARELIDKQRCEELRIKTTK